MEKINIENEEFEIAELTDTIKKQLQNLQFVDEQILQRSNELHIAQTAKIGYSLALKREIEKIRD